jgi:acyl-CoA synthetase (AMP-forming)/AMP-acid ligase II
VVARGSEVDVAELLAWCREQMANYKVPRAITFVDELPQTSSGKVQKFELRRRQPRV